MRKRNKRKAYKGLAIIMICVLLGGLIMDFTPFDFADEIFIDVGQGDSLHLDWDEINRYFPRMGRPTVTRNIHGEQPGQWQNGPMKTQPLGGRTTDLYNDPISHKYGPDFYSSKWQSRSEADRQKEIQGEIGRWNWGAFFFGWIWGAGHKYWMPLLWIIVANFVINLLTLFTGSMGFSLFLSYVVWFGVSSYLGINGSRIAWDKGCYTDIEHFRRKEHNWLIGGIIFFTVVLIINLIFIASLL